MYNQPEEYLKASELDVVGDLFGFVIVKRPKGESDLIHLYLEDDETYYYKMSFASFWLKDLYHSLSLAMEKSDMEVIFKK